jgi:hypothetical protein
MKGMSQTARGYVIQEGELCKSGFTELWLRCISIAQDKELLKEIHSGFCESHIGIRLLVAKARVSSCIWPLET